MKIDEFASVLQMPVEQMVAIGESQATNPASQIFKAIKLAATQKFAAVHAANNAEKKTRLQHRVYIQHVVSPETRYTLTSNFPHWEIKFANVGLKSASAARAIFSVTSEYLLEKVKTSKGHVVAYGMEIKPIVMRSREWVHLCVPGHEIRTQHEFIQEHRSICAMVNASRARGSSGGLPSRYVCGNTSVNCTSASKCEYKADAGVMMLTRTDTNFRQIAMFMLQHQHKLLYFAILAGKNLEFGTHGEIPHLDAYVNPSDDGQYFDVVYKKDVTLTQRFTYSNYLELVARVEVRVGGMIFRKEFDNAFLGVATYKVTCFPDDPQILPSPVTYNSWVEPKYKDQYMVYAPILSDVGDITKSASYGMIAFPVPITLVDQLSDAAMRAQGVKDYVGFISRKLNSLTSNVVVLNQIVQHNRLLAVTYFDILVFVVYCSTFMAKYKDGQAISTLAPHARDTANIPKAGFLSLVRQYSRVLVESSTPLLTQMATSIRQFYYQADSHRDLPLPSYVIQPGFVRYSDSHSSNPRFKSWETPDGDPTFGFSPSLPGNHFGHMKFFRDYMVDKYQSDDSEVVDTLLLTTGDAFVNNAADYADFTKKRIAVKDVQLYDHSTEMTDFWGTLSNAVYGILDSYPNLEEYGTMDDNEPIQLNPNLHGLYQPNLRFSPQRVEQTDAPMRPKNFSTEVNQVVDLVRNDNSLLTLPLSDSQFTAHRVFDSGFIPEKIPGHYSDIPEIDLRSGLQKIFPRSLIMNTAFFESDKFFGNQQYQLKGNRLKMDLSKLIPLKPERFFLPLIQGHVQPDVKDTPMNVIYAMQKRNANTPDNTMPMDENRVMEECWQAYLQVFCVDGTEQHLQSLPYIGPDELSIREWVSRLPEVKRAKLSKQDGYGVEDLNLSSNTLILKGKLKPNLGASYETSIKAPQSIQFDASGKSTATLSPVIGAKVMREQSVLRHNILVLQRKSVDDINRFINQFDWRPNEQGHRYYLEGDYETFDKTQGAMASKLHWHKCAKFGIMPHLVEFLKVHNTTRSISDLEAGIKMFLDIQRGSGHPDTLDGNNDVNEMVIAPLLLELIPQIEFIIIQGDDVIIALRGHRVDTIQWEYEISRRFNMSLKMSLQDHGYICSYDIVHLPDGHSLVVADVVKRSLSFMSLNKKDEDTFQEQFISFADNMKYVDDIRVQRYLSEALPKRMRLYLPGTDSAAIMDLLKACAKLKTDFSLFRSMFSEEKILRLY